MSDNILDSALSYIADHINKASTNDFTLMMNRELQMSVNPWGSGTCVVTGSTNYDIFIMYTSNGESLLGIRNNSNKIDIFALYTTSANTTHYTKAARINGETDSWTYTYNIKALGHGSASNHGTIGANENIVKIIGLIPKQDVIPDTSEVYTPITDFVISRYTQNNMVITEWKSGYIEISGTVTTSSSSLGAAEVFFPFSLQSTNCHIIASPVYASGAGDAGNGTNYTITVQTKTSNNYVSGLNLYIRVGSNYTNPISSRTMHFYVNGYKA